MPDVIVRINDPLVRVRLANEYRHVVDRTNIDLIHVLTAASEALRLDCEQALHAIVMDIRNDRLPTNLWSLVEQRQTNIKECIAYVYSFKIDSLLQIMNHAHL